LQFGLEPHAQTVQMNVLHTASALAHGEQWVVECVELVQADAAGHAMVFILRFKHFTVEVVFLE